MHQPFHPTAYLRLLLLRLLLRLPLLPWKWPVTVDPHPNNWKSKSLPRRKDSNYV